MFYLKGIDAEDYNHSMLHRKIKKQRSSSVDLDENLLSEEQLSFGWRARNIS